MTAKTKGEQSLARRVRKKLSPRSVKTSGVFTAILCYLVGSKEPWTRPALNGLCATSDGCLLAQEAGDIGYNHFIGLATDLDRNLRVIARLVGLDEKET